MSERSLNPDTLLFQSFPHSQGAGDVQINLLRYIELHYGIAPNFSPADEQLTPYRKVLLGAYRTGAATHVRFDLRATEADIDVEIVNAISIIQKSYHSSPSTYQKAYAKEFQDFTEEDAMNAFIENLLKKELKTFQYKEKWVALDDEEYSGRERRLQQRVSHGMASFLLYHGRDGHSTGYGELDDLYTAAWT